ncbi:MAG: hypothetical protein GX358_02820 [candidate division WS1 bacterium]|jgi:hypothetical protein|nr:hypothetical protein [candidate division WS1 bacterium]
MDLRKYRQAIVGGLKWIISQQRPDGTFQPLEFGMCGYHKLPYMLSLVAQGERATRLCAWVEANVMDEDGDFDDPHGRQGPMQDMYIYPNAWLAMGAHRLELYSMSYAAMEFLTSLQHPTTGGFLTAGPEASLSDRQDILSTAVAGLACLQVGATTVAQQAGSFLVSVFNSQPSAGSRLYFYLEDTDKFVTEYDDEVATQYALTLNRPGQWYFVPGMAACFLVKLYEATGEQSFLDAAQQYVRFADSSGEDRYGEARGGFFGMAAALLYAITDVNAYADIAKAVADNIVSAQMGNGSWAEASMGYIPPAPILDATAENVIVLSGILQTMGGREY